MNFADRCVHRAEAAILADPRNEWTLADRYATDEMFDRPAGRAGTPRATASGRRRPAACSRTAMSIDLGDRAFEVIHTPGHSPGGIALFETSDRHPALRRHRL